jgi:hypothetical protein
MDMAAINGSASRAVRLFLLGLGVVLSARVVGATDGTANSPGHGDVVGIVIDEVTQKPIAGAAIVIEDLGLIVDCDDQGRFAFASVPVGVHRLFASRTGYAGLYDTNVVVAAKRRTQLVLKLHALRGVEEEVVVRPSYFSQPAEVATSAVTMQYEDVRRAPGALGDINRMIQGSPGAAARDDSVNEIVARGGNPRENLLMVDGFEVPSLSHFGGHGASGGPITMLETELISDATFLAGGFPARYGSRLSSVLDIDLREGSRDRVQAEIDLSMAGTALITEGPVGSNGSWVVSARRSYLELIAGSFDLDAVPKYANYQAKGVYDLTPRLHLEVLSLGGRDTIEMRETEDLIDYHVDDLGQRSLHGASLHMLLSDTTVATLHLWRSDSRQGIEVIDETDDTEVLLRDRSRNSVSAGRIELSSSLGRLGTLQLGTILRSLEDRIDVALPSGVEDPWSSVPGRHDPVHVSKTVTSREDSAYGMWNVVLGSRTKLTLSGRYDRFDAIDESVFSPRASVTVSVSERVDVSASAGRYSQAPLAVLVAADPSNRSLQPIIADDGVLGVAFRPTADSRLSMEVYRKRYRNYPVSTKRPMLTFANDVSPQLLLEPLTSSGEGRAEGVEVFFQKKLKERVWGQIAYALSRVEHKAADGVWRLGDYDLTHVLTVIAGCNLPHSLEASTKLTYTTGRPYTPLLQPISAEQNREVYDQSTINGRRVPAYRRLDLRFGRRFGYSWGTLTSYVEIDNVFNSANVLTYEWDADTRQQQPINNLSRVIIGGFNLKL